MTILACVRAGSALLALAGLLSACSGSDSNPDPATADGLRVITQNDFESTAGWSDNPSHSNAAALLDEGRAHSGRFAIKVDKDHEFSLTYDRALGSISPRKFRRVRVECWVWLPGEQTGAAHLGLQVLDPETQQQVFGDGLVLPTVVKSYGQWAFVRHDFTLPDNVNSAQHLRVFFWRAGATEPVLADDVRLLID